MLRFDNPGKPSTNLVSGNADGFELDFNPKELEW